MGIVSRGENPHTAHLSLQFINHRSYTPIIKPRRKTLFDCYQLKSGTIEMFVPKGSIGNYLLYDRTYRIRYAGRSDTDLQSRLLSHVDESPYLYFKYWIADSPKKAYFKECEQYHECLTLGLLLNQNHPDRPENMPYLCCPVCSQ